MRDQKKIGAFFQNNLVLMTILILVGVTAIIEPKFLSIANLGNIMNQFGPLSFVSLGMTVAIIGGFIDLSVVGIVSLSAVFTISMIDVVGQYSALVAGLGAGALMGFINAQVIISCGAMTQAKSVFITFGLSSVYSALALLYTGGATQHMSYLNSSVTLYKLMGSGKVGFVSVSFILFLSGIFAALGAIVLFSRITTASPLLGANYDTNAILAVVVGGTSLVGGRGSVIRTMLGVMLVTLLANCLNLLGVSTYMQAICKGLVLIVAIWLDRRRVK